MAHYAETLLAALACQTAGTPGIWPEISTDPVLGSRLRLLEVLRACAGAAAPADGAAPAHLGALRATVRTALEGSRRSRTKPWALVNLLAEHALLEARFGERRDAQAAVRSLVALQSPDGSFYGNPLCTSLALLALTEISPGAAARHRCRAHLLGTQHADGTWRFVTTDVWDTQLLVRALRGEPEFDSRALGRALEFLYAAQRPDGGWPCGPGLESDNDTTASVLIALAGLPDTTDAVQRALGHLAREQNEAGLWPTWQSADDPPTPDVVAHVLTALDRYQGRHLVPTDAARRWIAEYALAAEGGWAAGWYHGTPYAVCEIAPALPAGHHAVKAELDRLAAAQQDDGSWEPTPGVGSTPSATGLALTALAKAPAGRGRRTGAAVSYLAATQRDDGSWPGRAEMYGPRPLLSHIHTQTQAFTVMGLRAAREQLRRSPGS
ncbi:prenyltransferase/squalene oxidase repeat-containing protein [Streptomyces sp. NPDC058412]|uniref:prenyltransferase/squalene oxidase repeat-containing protein n=1 Tax=Streptomyces sp. NPDC058412 TaxID=3346486 RepID=UPI00365CCED9